MSTHIQEFDGVSDGCTTCYECQHEFEAGEDVRFFAIWQNGSTKAYVFGECPDKDACQARVRARITANMRTLSY